MPTDFTRRPPPLRAASPVSTSTPHTRDAHDWTADMLSVARARDRAAFMRLYDHFMPRLCLYLRGVGVPEAVAEELAQESMLRLWQRAAAYDPGRSALATWLFRIARNLQIDRLRREAGHVRVGEAAIDAEWDAAPSTTEAYADHVQLQRRIDALSPVQARLIRMSYFEAKSHQEIADELGMPLGTVKSHVRRAFQRLQGEMGEGA